MTHHKIVLKSSEDMSDLEDNSVDLVVTSPPYNVGKDYSGPYDDGQTYATYLSMLDNVFSSCYSKLKNNRYCIINVARDSNVPLASDITQMMCGIGFYYNKSIYWVKPEGAAGQTMTMLYPYPRYYEPKLVTENILLFTKGDINGNRPERKEENRIEERYLKEYPSNVWQMNPETDKELLLRHPCPYPQQLADNCIRFYSNPGEKVLDPFLGTGTTMLCARKQGRDSVGFEINKEFKELILERTGLLYSGLSEDTYEVVI